MVQDAIAGPVWGRAAESGKCDRAESGKSVKLRIVENGVEEKMRWPAEFGVFSAALPCTGLSELWWGRGQPAICNGFP